MEAGQSVTRKGGRSLRLFRFSVVAVLVAALFVIPANTAFAARSSFNNWHVHDGTAVPYTDSSGLTHRSASIFPAIFGVSTAAYILDPTMWAYCTDATDKALVGGDGGAKSSAGHCENDLYIIHLQGIVTGDPAPSGWIGLPPNVPFPGFTIYYLLTPR